MITITITKKPDGLFPDKILESLQGLTLEFTPQPKHNPMVIIGNKNNDGYTIPILVLMEKLKQMGKNEVAKFFAPFNNANIIIPKAYCD